MADLGATFYGNCAGLYDRVATAPGVRSWRAHAAESLALSPGDTVVEMGCGTGANFPFLREQVGSEGRVIGLDVVPSMLERARSRIARQSWTNVHVLRADAARPPVDSADAVVATFVVGMLEDPGTAVREWVRSVEPGGRVTLLNAAPSPRPAALGLNLLLRVFVRLSAPGRRLSRESPTRTLERRWADARKALFEETVDHRETRLGFGLVALASGRVPA